MKKIAIAVIPLLLLAACGEADHKHGEAAEKAHAEEFERGPHRGRMLRSENLAMEITIFEEGIPPEFRTYPYANGKPLDPKSVKLEMRVTRLGGKVDSFSLIPQQDFLKATASVREPHSFDVEVIAEYSGKIGRWTYSSYEGRTTIKPDVAEAAGVKTETAGPATIAETIDLPGRTILAPHGRADVRAWLPGRIIEMTKLVGQSVQQGEVLARIEASDTLRVYQITAPMSGIIAERNANAGDIPTQALYTLIDPSKMQATLFAFPRDAERIRAGQTVEIQNLSGQRVTSQIQTLLPNTDSATQTVSILANIANLDGSWRSGSAIEGTIMVASQNVPLAVRTRALQRFRDFTVVFARFGDTYEVRMLKLGRRTPEWTEVLSGIDPGEVYVSDNAFLIRADIEKAGATHDH
ncbi:MAG: efflux RND transporter periplasmic adaptor subunit [Rhizobiales bacterium]|nr:efflux RND transporter periplasmic adaptor subunit [Hyphomicrobiales bacterium]OJY45821.1 MAG: HlyD family secretion protein [Rhizobiales bacterium 64-17]